ncbi:peptide/nickel transport system substrate-binding protein [Pararhizobium capsulatum DSM 1112]|uniref:Peptide/nickel transport system substrate-binding protein n=1 Tax=Pararhizobium capsulatum DSM 1112 TaxID=1121113 RepID=A0ABU0C1I8_9HYPH|nr:ABC transporter substrate-binding protein [Pararhizobium capsulatum]MDQ0323766.1 peptide/nickel transport system substrate-binding protein [Pararhizobium capsulatum DSM 1112]
MMNLRMIATKGTLFAGALFLASTALTGLVDAKSLTVGLTSDAVNLDPQAGEELSSNILFYHIYDPLVRRNADLSFGPGLAESWELADDTTWVFKLRKGVKFHNGEEFKASDVVFTLDRLKKSLMANLGANISSFKAIDDYTVEIKTPRPYAVLPNDLAAVLILNEKYVKEAGDETADLKPIGTGPYKLVEWVKEDHIALESNKDYYAGPAKLDTVTFRPITNGATRTAALLTGEVDVVQDLNVRDVDRVKADGRYKVLAQPSLLNVVLSIDQREKSPTVDLDKNPMVDHRVREAMVRAIDVGAINKVIMNGLSTPSEQYVPASHTGYLDGASFRDMYPFDVEKATALMAEAGYADGFTVTLDATNNRYVNDQQIVQALASMLGKIKINLKLNLMPKSNFFGYIRVPSDKSSLIMSGWDVPSGDGGSMYSVMFYTRDKKEGYGQVNRGSYSNPEVDALIDKADATAKLDQRDKFLQDVTKILMADIPMIPIHYEQDLYAAKTSVDITPRADKFLWAYDIDVKE